MHDSSVTLGVETCLGSKDPKSHQAGVSGFFCVSFLGKK